MTSTLTESRSVLSPIKSSIGLSRSMALRARLAALPPRIGLMVTPLPTIGSCGDIKPW
jgi:hypothetical protein